MTDGAQGQGVRLRGEERGFLKLSNMSLSGERSYLDRAVPEKKQLHISLPAGLGRKTTKKGGMPKPQVKTCRL